MLKIVLLTILASVILPGLASIGDRSMDYNYCLNYCIQKNCSNNPARQDSLPWHLRLFLWTCGDDCRYSCMHQVTIEDVTTRRPIRQFYGKVWNQNEKICIPHIYFSVAIYTTLRDTGASICNLLHIKLSYSLVWFLKSASKSTKRLLLPVDCSSLSTGTYNVLSHVNCVHQYWCRLQSMHGFGLLFFTLGMFL